MWCVGCGLPGVYICIFCAKTLPFVRFQRCVVCHRVSDYGKTHSNCVKLIENTAPYMYSFLTYRGITCSVIRKAKFYPDPELFRALMKSVPLSCHFDMVTIIRRSGVRGIVPIPISRTQQGWRGYNQAKIFAEFLGSLLDIPVVDVLTRVGERVLQSQTKQTERPQNISGLFRTHNTISKKLASLPVMLCDDIVTTGSTLREATKTLSVEKFQCKCWVTVCRSF